MRLETMQYQGRMEDSAKEKRIIFDKAKEVLNGVVKFEEGCQGE